MEKIYHINPGTGVPSICRAERGNCPYGGVDGKENHFNSYSEAQIHSQQIFEKKYRILPINGIEDPERIMQEIEARKKIKAEEAMRLPNGDEYEMTKEIMHTEDENLVMGVIEGEVYADNSWTYTSVALQNPNISRRFIVEAMFDYPGEFDKTTRRWLVLNKSLSHKALVSIIENEDEDMAVRAIAFRNPKLDKEYVENILKNDVEKVEKLPYSMIHYTKYANKDTDKIKNEATIFNSRERSGIDTAGNLAKEFNTWERKYRRKIEDDKQ